MFNLCDVCGLVVYGCCFDLGCLEFAIVCFDLVLLDTCGCCVYLSLFGFVLVWVCFEAYLDVCCFWCTGRFWIYV